MVSGRPEVVASRNSPRTRRENGCFESAGALWSGHSYPESVFLCPTRSRALAPEVPEEKGLAGYYPASVQAPSQVAKGVQVVNIGSGQLGPKSQHLSLQRLEGAGRVLMLTSLETQLTDRLSVSEERRTRSWLQSTEPRGGRGGPLPGGLERRANTSGRGSRSEFCSL